MGRGSRRAEPFTLILEFPLLQFRLNLVKHHSQLPKDLLQIAHIIVFQDLGLEAEQASAQA